MSGLWLAAAGPSRLPLVRHHPSSLAATTTLVTGPWRQPQRKQRSARPSILQERNLHTTSIRREEAQQSAGDEKAAGERASFKDPVKRYDYLVEKGVLKADPHQKEIIEKLERLWNDLSTYDPGPIPDEPSDLTPSFFGKFFQRTPSDLAPTMDIDNVPKGLYLHGSVGTGKTMLMDLFHSTVPPQFASSKYGSTRIHFHSFMLDVLHRQHAVKMKYAKTGQSQKDVMPEVARSLAAEGRVLCFDEFQVTDIVTAMILRQLLERLMGFGVVCVMTSNRHPDDLYLNGIQRGSFIPAIELLKSRFEVVDLNSETDYRKLPRALSKVYLHPLDPAVHSEMSKLFESFASSDPHSTEVVYNRKIPLWGRQLTVPESSGGVAKFSFTDLCNKPLSAADYLEVTGRFGTVFVENVPQLGIGERDQARRFITFIDACYENKVTPTCHSSPFAADDLSQTKLFVSSELPIFQIFSDDKGKAAADDSHMRSVMDDLGLSADDVGASSLFTGEEELFAFARCVSRLSQMGTMEWSEQAGPHRDPPSEEEATNAEH